jgi:ATP-dependent RNA helicase RhlB
VLDLNKSGQMNLMDLAFLVLDEADRMFDMGFYPDLRKLIKVVPPADRRQTMLFSATLNTWVKNLAWEYTKNPAEIEIEPETVTVDEVEQVLYHVQSADKMKLLLGILRRDQPESAIIFCNTKRYAEIVAKRLRVNGIDCEFIIGDLPQVKRLKIIDDLKAGQVRMLVATDVAARGLDIEGLAMVVNYDLPVESENYVHRIGRTARAGKTGKAITLASEQDVYELPDIEKYIGKKIPSEIAAQDLFGEDKSEGLRIRTDFYDDKRDRDDKRGGGRRAGRRPASGSGERRGGARRASAGSGERRDGARHSDSKRVSDGKRVSDSERASGDRKRTAKPRKESGRGERSGEPKLQAMSLEERMAYYKDKYGAPGKGSSNSGAAKERRQRADGERKAGGEKSAKSGQGRRKKQGQAAPKQQAAPQTSPQPAAEKKKGFLGKILGVFKKK